MGKVFTHNILLSVTIFIVQSLGCSVAPKSELPTKGPRVHNIAPAFIEFWNSVESLPVDEQRKKLKAEFFPRFPEFYDYKIEKWKKAGRNPDAELAKQLEQFPKIKNEFAQKANDITRNLNATMESFVKSLPDLDGNFDVYITHSLDEMDGGTRKIGGQIYFIFGVEGMVKYHKGVSSEVPFFHHELFHMYHGQFLPEDQVIWIALWAEGLATYASKKLNAGASFKDLMLDMPPGMVENINKDIAYHWNDLSSKLSSKEDRDYESYFMFSSTNKKVVKRAGYYLGYLLAKEIGKTTSLSEMAKLNNKEILPLLKREIDKLRKVRSSL